MTRRAVLLLVGATAATSNCREFKDPLDEPLTGGGAGGSGGGDSGAFDGGIGGYHPTARSPLIAGLVASWFVYSGYSGMDDVCAVSLVLGLFRGAIAFVVALPVAWAVLSRSQRV